MILLGSRLMSDIIPAAKVRRNRGQYAKCIIDETAEKFVARVRCKL